MPEYKPVTVEAARRIADEFAKSVVVVFAIDRAFDLMHYTTYGLEAHDKLEAAYYADAIAYVFSTADLEAKLVFEDFRLDSAKNKAAFDAAQKVNVELLAALKEAESMLVVAMNNDLAFKEADREEIIANHPVMKQIRDAIARGKAGVT